MRKALMYRVIPLLVLLAVVWVLLFGSSSAVFAADGDTTEAESIRTSDPLDDLDGAVIGGKDFDLANYPWNENGSPQMIYFAEVGYSMYSDLRNEYALYIYVYNPSGLAIDTESDYNKLELAFGENKTYDKYTLAFLTYSQAAGYEGLFYKFEVTLTEAQRTQALRLLSSNARVYTITGMEFSVGGQVTEYPVGYDTATEQGSVYTYSGYMLGYGSNLATESTLTCMVEGFSEYLTLDVEQTVYRPQGDFYEGDQSQLNSCWFTIPNEYIEKFGNVSKILYEWYEYVTKPILVTENSTIWRNLDDLHGGNTSALNNFYVLLIALSNTDSSWFGSHSDGLGWTSNVEMEDSYTFMDINASITTAIADDLFFSNLSAAFYTGGESYETFGISAEDLEQKFIENSQLLGDTSIVGKYASSLFENYVTDGRTMGYNKAESVDTLDIYWNTTTKDFWQQIFGGYDVTTEYDTVDAFHYVTAEDLSGSDAEVAELLYVDVDDVPALRLRFAAADLLDETVVLFRYANTGYYSMPVAQAYTTSYSEGETDNDLAYDCAKQWTGSWGSVGYSAYMARETVFLNFDIISITFTTEEGVSTEIPVVMSPEDVFSDVDPPLEENYHEGLGLLDIIKIVLIVLAVILLLIVLMPVLPYIVKGIVWIVCLPFKAIAALFKGIKKAVKKKPKDTGLAQAPPTAKSSGKTKQRKRKARKK